MKKMLANYNHVLKLQRDILCMQGQIGQGGFEFLTKPWRSSVMMLSSRSVTCRERPNSSSSTPSSTLIMSGELKYDWQVRTLVTVLAGLADGSPPKGRNIHVGTPSSSLIGYPAAKKGTDEQ